MAQRLRNRWRRPQRMTLEKPAGSRRKDIVVFDILPLDPTERRDENRSRVIKLAAAYLIPNLLVFVLVGVLLHPVLGGVLLAGFLGFLFKARSSFDDVIEASLGAAPGADPKIDNRLRLLCSQVGISPPKVFTVNSPNVDTLSIAFIRRHLVVTSAVAGLEELELEAVLAREVARLRDADSVVAGVYSLITEGPSVGGLFALGWLGIAGTATVKAFSGNILDPKDQLRSDVAGTHLTRYPPAMAQVIDTFTAPTGGTFSRWWASYGGTAERVELVSEM